jgi:hypothetical protein
MRNLDSFKPNHNVDNHQFNDFPSNFNKQTFQESNLHRGQVSSPDSRQDTGKNDQFEFIRRQLAAEEMRQAGHNQEKLSPVPEQDFADSFDRSHEETVTRRRAQGGPGQDEMFQFEDPGQHDAGRQSLSKILEAALDNKGDLWQNYLKKKSVSPQPFRNHTPKAQTNNSKNHPTLNHTPYHLKEAETLSFNPKDSPSQPHVPNPAFDSSTLADNLANLINQAIVKASEKINSTPHTKFPMNHGADYNNTMGNTKGTTRGDGMFGVNNQSGDSENPDLFCTGKFRKAIEGTGTIRESVLYQRRPNEFDGSGGFGMNLAPVVMENLGPYLKQLEESADPSGRVSGSRPFDVDVSEEGEITTKDLMFIKERFIKESDMNKMMSELSEGELMVNPRNAFDVE